jgi:putative addiction module component (TIGR02574 family)
MNVEEIKRLPTGEKIQIMEAIWDDFRDRFDSFELSPTDKAVLDERRERASNGTSQVRDWDAAKTGLGRNDHR